MSPESDKPVELNLADNPSAGFNRLIANNDIVFALGLAVVLVTLLLPLPTSVLDLLLACSLAISVATLVIVLSAREAIELSTFPSLLLFVTLFRLSLNVASTRLILIQASAGDIIATFGQMVAGGNLVIGLVVFLILAVIQFIVITKGAERISEVAARFNLDAMPGKQMAIDADLNAGSINEEQARLRRRKIARESEFYGAMDGASKFIRGDAIAGLIIVAVNLVGGIVIGLTRGMSTAQAIETYSILAVGDGLVTQIPAVIIATASGFLITKTSTQSSLSNDLVRQMLSRSRPLFIASFLLGAMVFVPSFPKLPFVVLSLGTALLARHLRKLEAESAAAQAKPKAEPAPEPTTTVDDALDVDKVSILVGPRLIRTVDPRRKDSLSHRISPLRKKFAQQLGIVLPLMRLRDSVTLQPNAYEIRLHNHVVTSGQLEPDKLLAMDGGGVTQPIQGLPTREPVFNLPALWIPTDQKEAAELRGYTVVDPESVLITHLSETLNRHAHELLSRDDVQKLVDKLQEKQPALVKGAIGEAVPIGLLHRVLQLLLRDRIPIRDLDKIIEAVSDHAGRTRDPHLLMEHARKALVRTITELHADARGQVTAIIFDPSVEYELRGCLTREGDQEVLALMPERAVELTQQLAEGWKHALEQGHEKVVLLCDHRLRPHLAQLLGRQLPQLAVVAYDEIIIGTKVQPVATVTLPAVTLALPA